MTTAPFATRRSAGPIVAGTWLVLAALGAPSLADADCKLLKIAEFRTAPDTREPIVDAAINGRPVKALIDTGAVASMIPLHEARQLGLIVTEVHGRWMHDVIAGDTHVYQTHIRLKIGDVEKRDLVLLVAGDSYRPSNVSLILGDDFLAQTDAEFDLPENAIRLFQAQSCSPPQLVYWGAPYSQVKFMSNDRDSPDIEAEALLNGRKVWGMLDSGDPSSWVDTATGSAVGVRWASPDAADGPRMSGFGPISADSRIGVFDSFSLGDERVSNVRLPVAPYDYGQWYRPRIWIAADFFRAHRIYVDVKDHLILFSYVGGPIFDQDAPSH